MTLPRADVLPAELRERPQWVAWKLEIVPGRPKPAKVPYTAGGRRASTTAPADWLTFAQASALAEEKSYSGVGFVFTADDEYVGIDLDGVLGPEGVAPQAQAIVDAFPGAYVERSQSGKGLHLIMCGKLPPGARRKGAIESYETGRYFAITGDVWPPDRQLVTALPNVTSSLAGFHSQYLGGELATTTSSATPVTSEEQQAILARIAAGPDGIAFHRLFIAGETRPGKSGSESDIALAVVLAKYTQDAATIATLMQASPLKRPKWAERHGTETYLERTIRQALLRVPAAMAEGGGDGATFKTLAELAENPDALTLPDPVLRGIGWRGRVTMLAAREKQGKSTLVAAGAAALTQGKPFLGFPTPGPADVAWISADREALPDVIQRSKRFGADLTRWHLLYPRTAADVGSALTALPRVPTLVIVDTLWSLLASDVEDPHGAGRWPQALAPFIAFARDHNTAVVLLHHASKKDGGYRDSTAIGAAMDMLLDMRAVNGSPLTRNVKAVGRFAADDFSVTLEGNTYQWSAPARPKEERLAELEGAVLGWLREHPESSQNQIEEGCGGKGSEIRDVVKNLLTRGDLQVARRKGSGGGSVYSVRAAF